MGSAIIELLAAVFVVVGVSVTSALSIFSKINQLLSIRLLGVTATETVVATGKDVGVEA